MTGISVYDLLKNMQGENIIFAYKGQVNEGLLEAVYSMMEKQFDEGKITLSRRKKFFQILIESLQNVLHHQENHNPDNLTEEGFTGFVIKNSGNDAYSITTGNLIKNTSIDSLKMKLDKVNSLSPEEIKSHYQQALAGSEFSGKGGAGLGLIEMARKSGNKLGYEFAHINEVYSFFCLTITIP